MDQTKYIEKFLKLCGMENSRTTVVSLIVVSRFSESNLFIPIYPFPTCLVPALFPPFASLRVPAQPTLAPLGVYHSSKI